jgi:GTP cyclohydrolase IA
MEAPVEAIKQLLAYMGEDTTRDGLQDTPKRVCKAMLELTQGYGADIGSILSVSFDVAYDEMVIVRDMPFVSLCEHHMLPFTGTATIAYIPQERVVGLSKLARLLDAFSQRLQVQERLTMQIADAIEEHLQPLGTGVVIHGHHSCMACRGVKKHGEMITSALRGVLRTCEPARAEFLSLSEH